MGAGASMETLLSGSEGSNRFFCHQCNRMFPQDFGEPLPSSCIYCESTFIEHIVQQPIIHRLRDRQQGDRSALNEEQTRRLLNAALMLRLLEHQLRDELQQLNETYSGLTGGGGVGDETKSKVEGSSLSVLEQAKLRNVPATLDSIINQPGCPICSEEYAVAEVLMQLPCSHFFHSGCVLPWLSSKKTCPICRFVINEDVPAIEEIERSHTFEELNKKLAQLKAENGGDDNDDIVQTPTRSRRELAGQVRSNMILQKQRHDDAATASSSAAAAFASLRVDQIRPSPFPLPFLATAHQHHQHHQHQHQQHHLQQHQHHQLGLFSGSVLFDGEHDDGEGEGGEGDGWEDEDDDEDQHITQAETELNAMFRSALGGGSTTSMGPLYNPLIRPTPTPGTFILVPTSSSSASSGQYTSVRAINGQMTRQMPRALNPALFSPHNDVDDID